jgi:hypothetical protein
MLYYCKLVRLSHSPDFLTEWIRSHLAYKDGTTTFSLTTFGIKTLSIMDYIVPLGISLKCHYAVSWRHTRLGYKWLTTTNALPYNIAILVVTFLKD